MKTRIDHLQERVGKLEVDVAKVKAEIEQEKLVEKMGAEIVECSPGVPHDWQVTHWKAHTPSRPVFSWSQSSPVGHVVGQSTINIRARCSRCPAQITLDK